VATSIDDHFMPLRNYIVLLAIWALCQSALAGAPDADCPSDNWIYISSENGCRFNTVTSPCDSLGLRLNSLRIAGTCEVRIAVDRSSKYQPVSHALQSLHDAGFVDLGFVNLESRNAFPKSKLVQVPIRHECRPLFYGPDFIDIEASDTSTKKAQPRPSYLPWDPDRARTLAFIDPRTTITFYVESDGRHLVALDPRGTVLWIRDPFEDQRLCPYRTPRPVIGRVAPAELSENYKPILARRGVDTAHPFVIITFDSSQFGLIDETTGDFFPEGQN
jgi:hypothetical protein